MALSSEFGANKTKFGHFGGKNGDLAIFHLKMAKMAIFGKKKCNFFTFCRKLLFWRFLVKIWRFLEEKWGFWRFLVIFGKKVPKWLFFAKKGPAKFSRVFWSNFEP